MKKNIISNELTVKELYELYTSSLLLRKKSYEKLVEIRRLALNGKQYNSYNKAHELADNLYHEIYRKLCDIINEGKPIPEHLIKQKVQEFIENHPLESMKVESINGSPLLSVTF